MAQVLPQTIEDLREPSFKSGFRHVGFSPDMTKPYHAQVYGGKRNKAGHEWQGPGRLTGEEAAQDYLDHIHQRPQQPAPSLKTAGHNGKRDPIQRDPEVEAALGVLRDARGQRQGRQGYVYLIIEKIPGGGLRYGKVGYSTNPQARVAELQCGNPRPLTLHGIKAVPGPEAEAELHRKYAYQNVLQEWFWITKDLLLEFDPVPSQNERKEA